MRVLFLTGGFPTVDNPSKSIFNFRAANQLATRTDVLVIQLRYWKPGRRFKEFQHYEGLSVLAISLPWIAIENNLILGINLLLWQKAIYFLLKNEIKHDDIIHSVGLDIGGVVGAYLSRKRKIPHFAQCIGSDVNFHLPKLIKFPWVRNLSQSTKMVICNSNFLKSQVNKLFPNIIAVVVYRGTDINKFKPLNTENWKKKDKFSFLYMGGFANRSSTDFGSDLKGGETLMEAWSLIEQQIGMKAELLLGGPQAEENRYISWLDTLVNKESVRFLGQINPKDISSVFHEIDFVLIPSRSEGLPNVGVEACACGKIVIASNVGGIPELIINNETGILIEAGDTLKLAKTMKEVVQNANRYSHISLYARQRVEKYFNAANYADKLLDIYKLS